MRKGKMNLFCCLAIIITLMFIITAAGCHSPESGLHERNGFSLEIPDDWVITDEKERDEVISLKLQSDIYDKGHFIITALPVDSISEEETVNEARRLLQNSLFRVKGEIEVDEKMLNGETIPLLSAESGERELFYAQTGILTGQERYIFVTLVNTADAGNHYHDTFDSLLKLTAEQAG